MTQIDRGSPWNHVSRTMFFLTITQRRSKMGRIRQNLRGGLFLSVCSHQSLDEPQAVESRREQFVLLRRKRARSHHQLPLVRRIRRASPIRTGTEGGAPICGGGGERRRRRRRQHGRHQGARSLHPARHLSLHARRESKRERERDGLTSKDGPNPTSAAGSDPNLCLASPPLISPSEIGRAHV